MPFDTRSTGGRDAFGASVRPSRLTPLVVVTAVIYLVHAVALACGALLRTPGTNSASTLGALALTAAGLAAYAVGRGSLFTTAEATAMLVVQVGVVAAMSHTTHLDLAALSNGIGLSMLGAYASWLLAWPAATVYYTGLSVWVAVIALRGSLFLTVAAVLIAVQGLVTAEIVRALRRRVRLLTHVDPLTGVLNRRGLEEYARTAVARNARRGKAVCVAVVDLDDLREVNNSAGHLAGDRLLVAAAQEWRRAFDRSPVAVGRVGGDEFVFLFEGTDEATARSLMASLRMASTVQWTAGVAEIGPDGSLTQALARADAEMYDTKAASRASGRA